MTQEEKDLLLKDLCARLPYKVKYMDVLNPDEQPSILQSIDESGLVMAKDGFSFDIVNIKPYLFPLSSLTKEQRNIISNKLKEIQINNPPFGKIHDNGTDNLLNNITLCAQWLINYYDENHLDHRGLIEKGLANNAQNYPNVYNDYDK